MALRDSEPPTYGHGLTPARMLLRWVLGGTVSSLADTTAGQQSSWFRKHHREGEAGTGRGIRTVRAFIPRVTGWSLQQAGQAVHEGMQVLGSGKRDQLGQDLLRQPRLWGPVGAEKPGLQWHPQGLPQDRNDSRRSWGGDERERSQMPQPCGLGEVTLVAQDGTLASSDAMEIDKCYASVFPESRMLKRSAARHWPPVTTQPSQGLFSPVGPRSKVMTRW